MLTNYLRAAWRNIRHQKLHSLITISGLGVGIACCLMILFWVQDERGYDRFHRNENSIFRVVSDWAKNDWNGVEATPFPLGPEVKANLPLVQNMTRLYADGRKVFRYGEKTFFDDRGIVVDLAFFEIFSFPFAKGDIKSAFRGPEDIVISESLARKYFGSEEPLGKTIHVEGRPQVVRGILKDIPRQSSLQFQYARSVEFESIQPHWGAYNASTFILLAAGANLKSVGPAITAIGLKHGSPQVVNGARFRLQRLRDIHLDARPYQSAVIDLGDSTAVLLFSLIALFVLVVAIINFVNLSLARAGSRAKEVALRKVTGADRTEIARQFFCESCLMVALASALACVLVFALLPSFNQLAGKTLSLDLLQSRYWVILAAVTLATALASGAFPAIVLSAFQPIASLRGNAPSGERGGLFRKILVLFQFTLSIGLLISAVVVISQFRFMREAQLGYDPNHVLLLPIKGAIGNRYEVLKERLRQHPAVLGVTAQAYPFAEKNYRSAGNWNWESREPNQQLDCVYRGITYDFFETMDIPLAAGRSFDKGHAEDAEGSIILNERAVKAMGMKDPIGKWFSPSPDDRRMIIGVVKDPHFQTLHFPTDPEAYYLTDMSKEVNEGMAMVRIDRRNISGALAHVRRVWSELAMGMPFELRYLNDTYDRLYRAEFRLSRVLSLFAGLAILIACLGLLGLTIFTAGRRRKEVGIRKVLGASTTAVAMMFSGQMLKWILCANLLAWPAAFFAMNALLRSYANRIPLNGGFFLLPSLGILLLAFLTVMLQAAWTARMNPIEALRQE